MLGVGMPVKCVEVRTVSPVKAHRCSMTQDREDVIPAQVRNPGCRGVWIPAPRFRGDKFTPAEAGAGMTRRNMTVAARSGRRYFTLGE